MATLTPEAPSKENIKILGLLNIAGTILGGIGWLAVIVYYIVKKDSF